jgi:hypothetical protein
MSQELYLKNSRTGSWALNRSMAQAISARTTMAEIAPARMTAPLPCAVSAA